MQPHIPTTPFGRRPASLGQIAAQHRIAELASEAGKPGSNAPAAVHKWNLFRTITEARTRLCLSDRSLSVLNALLSFHPETALTLPAASGAEAHVDEAQGHAGTQSCALVVFPSNKALTLRTHGMAEKTLRNHLAALVAAGLIIRRDSPNGKRYSRRALADGERVADAFGFDLTPLVARAPEFEALAEDVRRERHMVVRLKEAISLLRRDCGKLIAMGLDEGLAGPWDDYRLRFLGLLTPVRRLKGPPALQELADRLAELQREVATTLESFGDIRINTGKDGYCDRHLSDSNTETHTDLEPASNEEGSEIAATADADGLAMQETPLGESVLSGSISVGLVMEACPDMSDYHFSGGKIRTWPEFEALSAQVRPMLGISPDAWAQAVDVLGARAASIAIAIILQRCEHSSEARVQPGGGVSVNGSPAIRSPGGYLRALTDKARAGDFAIGPVLMALIGQRQKSRRRGRSAEA